MKLFTFTPFLFIILSAFVSPFGADYLLLLGEEYQPSFPSYELDLEPSEVEVQNAPTEKQFPELSDNEIDHFINEILEKAQDWEEDEDIQETPQLAGDFKDFQIKYQPSRKRSMNSGFREERKERQERIRKKRQVYNNRNRQQFRRGPPYQTNYRRNNQNFRNRNFNPGGYNNYPRRRNGARRNRNRNNQGIFGLFGLGNIFGNLFGGGGGTRSRGRSRGRNYGGGSGGNRLASEASSRSRSRARSRASANGNAARSRSSASSRSSRSRSSRSRSSRSRSSRSRSSASSRSRSSSRRSSSSRRG